MSAFKFGAVEKIVQRLEKNYEMRRTRTHDQYKDDVFVPAEVNLKSFGDEIGWRWTG